MNLLNKPPTTSQNTEVLNRPFSKESRCSEGEVFDFPWREKTKNSLATEGAMKVPVTLVLSLLKWDDGTLVGISQAAGKLS